MYFVSDQAKGMYGSTHSAFAFVPAKDIAPPTEIARMKQVLHNDAALTANGSQRKQKKLLEEWIDDAHHPQIEIITYPVRKLFLFLRPARLAP